MLKKFQKHSPDEIIIYLRKSRADDPTMSVEEVLQKHESILQKWAAENLGEQIPESNIYREVVSGETIDGRPEIQKIFKRMESPRIKAILTVDVQRLSRGDLEDCGRLMKLLRYTHTCVITPHQTYDLEDDYDRDFFERELKRGNEYLEYVKKILHRGTLQSIQEGNFVGTIPPYGYDKSYVMEGKRKCPTLIPNESEAKIVNLIFKWYAYEDIGATTICHRLNDMGTPTRTGSKWTRGTIRDILTNEHYIGMIRHNHRIKTYTVIDQEVLKVSKNNKDYDLYPGKHAPIISKELFDAAQNVRGSKNRCKTDTALQNPLASILYCRCGKCMQYTLRKGKRSFQCDAQKYCKTASVSADEVLALVCEYLKKSIDDFTVLSQNDNSTAADAHLEQISILERRLKELNNKEISLWDKYSEEGMPKEIFENLKNKCMEDKKAVEAALQKAYSDIPENIDYEEKIIRLHEAIDALVDNSVSATAKNKLLKNIIDRIDYDRPESIRMSKEDADKRGIVLHGGYYMQDFTLDIHLSI